MGVVQLGSEPLGSGQGPFALLDCDVETAASAAGSSSPTLSFANVLLRSVKLPSESNWLLGIHLMPGLLGPEMVSSGGTKG